MNFTEDQIQAIEHLDGPALILAVPGSGKTTVLIHRTYNLIKNHGIDPKSIISITFSRASAIDMKKRFIKLFPDLRDQAPFFATIHSFCFSIVRRYASYNNREIKLIENSKNSKFNKYKILESIYYQVNKSTISEDDMSELLNNIGYIKNMMISPDVFLDEFETDVRNLKEIFFLYEKYKKDRGLLDFDDMLIYALEIFKKDKNLLRHYKDQFKYIQVDEAQDTSKVQIEIIKILAEDNKNLFIVADDDQSIYKFRGAYPQELLKFPQIYPSSKVIYMEENFRSSLNIVELSNAFIKSNKNRYKKEIYTNNPRNVNPKIYTAKSSTEQYKYIVDDIKKNNLNYKDTCIIYRNNMSSLGLVNYLLDQNIAFYTKDHNNKFFSHWILDDIFNFLEFSQDTSNLIIFENIFYKMKGFISRKQINYVKKLNPNLCVFDRLLDFPDLPYYYQDNFYDLISEFELISKMSIYNAICHIENHLEYKDFLKENSNRFGNNFNYMNKLLHYLKILSKDCNSIGDLKRKLNHIQKAYYESKDNNGITLTTAHSSKGLEFENVYIIDLVEEEFPSIKNSDIKELKLKKSNTSQLKEKEFLKIEENLEEERRLFYVAMTRAKKNLNFITLKYINGDKVKKSLFLDEILALSK